MLCCIRKGRTEIKDYTTSSNKVTCFEINVFIKTDNKFHFSHNEEVLKTVINTKETNITRGSVSVCVRVRTEPTTSPHEAFPIRILFILLKSYLKQTKSTRLLGMHVPDETLQHNCLS